MRRAPLVGLVIVALAVALAACGGGDDTSTTADSGPDAGLEENGQDTGDAASGGASSSQIASIWPLPPSEGASTIEPYERSDQDGVITEHASFEFVGTDLATVRDFYTSYFDSQGLEWSEFEAASSIVLNLTYPGRPGVAAVVQVGETAGVVTVNQERTEVTDGSEPLAETVDPDDPQEMDEGSGGGEGAGDPAPDTSEAPDASEPPAASQGALLLDGGQAAVAWALVNDTYVPADGGADPFFHIHSSNDADGFYLSFEFYTVWGQAWTGETGTFDIACQDPSRDTGICVHFDPDGPGPAGDLGADFGARGTVVIRQLDKGGYDVDVIGLAFTDGTTFEDFTMSSEPGGGSE